MCGGPDAIWLAKLERGARRYEDGDRWGLSGSAILGQRWRTRRRDVRRANGGCPEDGGMLLGLAGVPMPIQIAD